MELQERTKPELEIVPSREAPTGPALVAAVWSDALKNVTFLGAGAGLTYWLAPSWLATGLFCIGALIAVVEVLHQLVQVALLSVLSVVVLLGKRREPELPYYLLGLPARLLEASVGVYAIWKLYPVVFP